MSEQKIAPVLSDDELDPRLLGWLQARQDWSHVLLDQAAVRQLIAVLARVGAVRDQAVRDGALQDAIDIVAQEIGWGRVSFVEIAAAIRALKGTRAAAVAEQRECGNGDCGWQGTTNRMCGTIGPLCPKCGETTERSLPQPSSNPGPLAAAEPTPDHGPIAVGDIGNYYGGLSLKRELGIDYWSIENYDGENWSVCDLGVANAIRAAIAASKEGASHG